MDDTRDADTARVIVGMTVSLDGYVNDRNGSVDKLYPDLEALRQTESLQETIRVTGAVVMGRHAYDMGQGDFTDYEFQTPIFVVTHHPPEHAAKGENDRLKIALVREGVAEAIEQGCRAAGNRQVQIIRRLTGVRTDAVV